MQDVTLKGRSIVEGHATGEALVSRQPLSFLGGVEPADGKIIEKGHDLSGICIKDKIFCFPSGHGSTVGSYVLYSLVKNGLAPKGIVNRFADPVVVVGAIISNVPMVDQIDIEQIKTGDIVEVDGAKGIVKIHKKERAEAVCT